MSGCLLQLLRVRRPEHAEEIFAAARDLAAERGRCAGLVETASLVALATRPARPRTAWLHDALIAALLVALVAAALLWL